MEFCDEIELLLANCAQYSTPNLVSFAYDFYDIRAASWHTPHLKLHYDGLHHAVELQVVLADLREWVFRLLQLFMSSYCGVAKRVAD